MGKKKKTRHQKKKIEDNSASERLNTLQITRGEKSILLTSTDLTMYELVELMEQIGYKYFNNKNENNKESYYT